MGLPFGKAIISPILVGRDAQRESLERALDGIAAGQGQTILISGEAGIGKSRLIAEAKSSAARRGFTLLEGHCFEPDRSLPYAPLADLLRARFAHRHPSDVAHELGSTGPELVKLIPDLMSLLPDLAITPALAPEQEQRRLFLALLQFVTVLATTRPGVVVVEDLHWSDDTSLELLLRLARRVASMPLLLLLTYRTDEPHATLSHMLAELDRERLATELILPPLAPAEVDTMLRAMFAIDRPIRTEFLLAIGDICEGNPFFIEEVLTSLVASGDIVHTAGGWERKPIDRLRIPRTIHDAVRRRSMRLSQDARQMLEIAAVAGQRFEIAVLQAVLQWDEDALLEAIKELIAAQLIVEVSPVQFAFRHVLIRQAISSALLARERVRLHERIAEALEVVYAGSLDAHWEDLSYHVHAAEVWPKALAYGQRAGERALAMYAPRPAIEHFGRALAAARHVSGAATASLLHGRGPAYGTLGEFSRARDDFEAGLAAARATGDCRGEWQALLNLGFLLSGHDYVLAGDFLRQAVALARERGDPADLAHALNRLGNWHINVEQPLAGREFHEEALAIFRGLDDRRGVAEALDLLGLASNMGSDLEMSAAYYEDAVALFQELEDRQGLA
ncbi:MAG: ATP-binding protein, partial [Thermomicrobiales bacterium]